MKKISALLLAGTMGFGTTSLANGSAEDLGGPIEISGKIVTDASWDTAVEAENLRFKGGKIKITAKLAKHIKLVLGFDLQRELIKNGVEVSDDFDFEDFFKEAYIEIKNVGGQALVFVVGKHEIAFGQDYAGLPIYHNNPVHGAAEYNEVFGFTMRYEMDNFFDLIEISAFETEKSDLSIGEINGGSVRLTKKMNDKLKAKLSAARIDEETRISLGFVFEEGKWTTWAEGLYVEGSAKYPDAGYMITGGVKRDLGPGRVAVEGSFIQDTLWQLGIGYEMPIADNVTVGPEIRYTDRENGESGWQVGVRTTIKFGKKKRKFISEEDMEETLEEIETEELDSVE